MLGGPRLSPKFYPVWLTLLVSLPCLGIKWHFCAGSQFDIVSLSFCPQLQKVHTFICLAPSLRCLVDVFNSIMSKIKFLFAICFSFEIISDLQKDGSFSSILRPVCSGSFQLLQSLQDKHVAVYHSLTERDQDCTQRQHYPSREIPGASITSNSSSHGPGSAGKGVHSVSAN